MINLIVLKLEALVLNIKHIKIGFIMLKEISLEFLHNNNKN